MPNSIIEHEIELMYSGNMLNMFLDSFSIMIEKRKSIIFIFFVSFLMSLSLLFKIFQLNNLSFIPCAVIFGTVGVHLTIEAIKKLASREFSVDGLMILIAFLLLITDNIFEGALLISLFFAAEEIQELVKKIIMSNIANKNHKLNGIVDVFGNNGIESKNYKDLLIGDIILARSGDVIPCGVVACSDTAISLSNINGEAEEQSIKEGENIIAGAINVGGDIKAVVVERFATSVVYNILSNVSRKDKDPSFLEDNSIYRFFLKYYSFFLIVGFFSYALYMIVFDYTSFFGAGGVLYRTTSLIIIMSPCAVFMPIPIIQVCGIIYMYKKGMMIRKFAEFFNLKDVKTVFFDKTGTLTSNGSEMKVVKVENNSHVDIEEYASIVFETEKRIKHPIARCLVNWARVASGGLKDKYRDAVDVKHYRDGITGNIQKKRFRIGSSKIVDDNYKVIDVEIDNIKISLYISSAIRKGVVDCVSKLKEMNIEVKMLTGDSQSNACKIGRMIGMQDEDIFHGCGPDEKIEVIEHHKSDKHSVVMVGDGINDILALQSADFGISVSNSTLELVTISVSSAVVLEDYLDSIVDLIIKRKRLQKIVVQNISIALVVIILGAVLVLTLPVPIWVSVILHEGSTAVLSLNAMRMLS